MIPTGTTGRQLDALARWMLASLVVTAMLLWTRPTFAGWGALMMGLVATLVIYLMSRTVLADRRIPAHPVYMALVVPAALLGWHITRERFWGHSGQGAVAGALNLSMLFHLCLFALTVMLSQSLLPKATRHVVVLLVVGGAMMLAPFAGGALYPEAFMVMRHASVFLGASGVCVWLSSLWGIGRGRSEEASDIQLRHGVSRWTVCIVAAIVSAGLVVISPKAALLAMTAMAVVAFVGGATFHHARWLTMVPLAVVAAAGSAAIWRDLWRQVQLLPFGEFSVLGLGEQGLYHAQAGDSGPVTLGWVLGLAGLAWLAAGMLTAGGWLFARSYKRRDGDQGRVVIWTCAVFMASTALLAGGGFFAPAMTVAAGLTWGMYPQMINRNTRTVSGVSFLVVLVVLAASMAIAARPGLATWSAAAVTRSPLADKWLHGVAGGLLTLTLTWLMGARRLWLGLVAIALAALAGGQAEWAQKLFSSRNVDMRDWQAHMIGVALAGGLYVLCMLSRGCESSRPDEWDQRERLSEKYAPM